MINNIRDYHQLNSHLATSGQPTSEQFLMIAQAGYEVVINLAPANSTNALVNEDALVTDLNLIYIQIPVSWSEPQINDVKLFFKLMKSLRGQKIWVHCAKNMRVSCFIYLWQKYVLQLTETEARYSMNQIWQPTGVWQKLIDSAAIELV